MLKYIFMGTPPIAASILETLCQKAYPPILVVTQPAKEAGRGQKVRASAVETAARKMGLPVWEVPNISEAEMVEKLKAMHPDLFLVVAFGQILKESALAVPRLGSLNVHASLLPKYRGAAPIQRAILNGDPETGISVQKIVRKLDAGDVLLQKKLAIGEDDTSATLLDRLSILGGECLVEALAVMEKGTAHFTPQDPAGVTIARKLEKEEARLNFAQGATALRNAIRAFQPWPVAEIRLNGAQVRVFRASVVKAKAGTVPGQIETDKKTFFHITCGDGQALSLLELQMENRKRLPVEEFLRGYPGSLTQVEPAP